MPISKSQKDLAERIKKDLQKMGDRTLAEKDKKYHRYAGYKSFGIKSPARHKLLQQYRHEIKEMDCRDVFSCISTLLYWKVEDLSLAAIFILKNKIDCIDRQHLNSLDTILEKLFSWSQVDEFCITVLQPLLKKYPTEMVRKIRVWNQSGNKWARRASVVVFTRSMGESGEYTDIALDLCRNLMWDEDDLVRKGVGWCLKDVLRGDKKVLSVVKDMRSLGVSSTITLYAIRDLRGSERADILSIEKQQS